MILDPDDPKVRWATFGKQVEDFLQSDIGDYLLKCAEKDVLDAVGELKKVYPWRTRKIRELQNKIAVAESVQIWLGDAISSGQAALEQLRSDHE